MTEIRTCPVCGAEFRPNVWNQKFCSRKCKRKSYRDRKRKLEGKKPTQPKRKRTVNPYGMILMLQTCEWCGQTFRNPTIRRYCPPTTLGQPSPCSTAARKLRTFITNLMRPPKPSKWTPKTLKWLNRRSDENMIHLYHEELGKILKGTAYPSDVLPNGVRRRLMRRGLLVRDEGWGRKTELAPRALEILEALDG